MADTRYAVVGQLRDRITKSQARAIKQLYRGVLSSLYKEEQKLKKLGITDSVRVTQIRELRSTTIRLLRQVTDKLTSNAEAGMLEVIDATLELYGASTASAQAMVMSFVTGNVYGGSWTLSSSIWGNNSKQVRDVYNIVARGQLLGYSFEQIADQLKKYVNPDKLYDWDGPGSLHIYSHSIDYNAQRLIRTLVTHAYQYAQWAMTHDDPTLLGYRWHAQGPRACPICKERNGVIFPVNSVPWDHPNGACYIEPVYSSRHDMDAFRDFAVESFLTRHTHHFDKLIS